MLQLHHGCCPEEGETDMEKQYRSSTWQIGLESDLYSLWSLKIDAVLLWTWNLAGLKCLPATAEHFSKQRNRIRTWTLLQERWNRMSWRGGSHYMYCFRCYTCHAGRTGQALNRSWPQRKRSSCKRSPETRFAHGHDPLPRLSRRVSKLFYALRLYASFNFPIFKCWIKKVETRWISLTTIHAVRL